MNFARRLRDARINHGLTQQQVADMLEVTVSTYCGYETGKRCPNIEKLKALANILQVSSDSLLGLDDSDRYVEDVLLLKQGDDGKWEIKPEPYLTIEIDSEETWDKLREVIRFWNNSHPDDKVFEKAVQDD